MTKTQFRKHWEAVFTSFNDAELYAIHVWVLQMKASNGWYQWVGKAWDAYLAQHDKEVEQIAEETQPADGQSVH